MSLFWRDVDFTHTALLLSDVQTQLLGHMPTAARDSYLGAVDMHLAAFRQVASQQRARPGGPTSPASTEGLPVIVHHVVAMDLATMNLSPYNKLNNWALKRLHAAPQPPGSGAAAGATADPAPTVPASLHPPQGWNADEFVLTKQAPSCFMSSTLLKFSRRATSSTSCWSA